MLLRIYMGSFPCGQAGWLLHLNVNRKGSTARLVMSHLSCFRVVFERLFVSFQHVVLYLLIFIYFFKLIFYYQDLLKLYLLPTSHLCLFCLQCIATVMFISSHSGALVLLINPYHIFLQYTNRQRQPLCNIACDCFLFTTGLCEEIKECFTESLAIGNKYQ